MHSAQIIMMSCPISSDEQRAIYTLLSQDVSTGSSDKYLNRALYIINKSLIWNKFTKLKKLLST